MDQLVMLRKIFDANSETLFKWIICLTRVLCVSVSFAQTLAAVALKYVGYR